MSLQSTKKGSLSVTGYYNRIKSTTDSLIAARNLVTDEELGLYILGGLNSDYDPVVVNITARNTMPSIKEIYSLLLTHECRLEQTNSFGSIDLGNPTANYVGYTSRNSNQGAYNRNQNISNNRGGLRARGKGRHNGGRNNSKPTCQVCGKYGHSASVCYYHFDRNFSHQ